MLKNKDIVINQKVSINYKLTHQNLNISFVTLTGNIVFKSKKFEIVEKLERIKAQLILIEKEI